MAVRSLRKSWDEKLKDRKEKEVVKAFQKEIRSSLADQQKVEAL